MKGLSAVTIQVCGPKERGMKKLLALLLCLALIYEPALAGIPKDKAQYSGGTVAQEKPQAGIAPNEGCRANFIVHRWVHRPEPPLEVLARMTDAEKEQWRKNSTTKLEGMPAPYEKRWIEKEHKKHLGLCYAPPRLLAGALEWDEALRSRIGDVPVYVLSFSEYGEQRSETQWQTQTTESDVPVHGTAPVYDQYGDPVGTADVTGTVRVEGSESYPVRVTIRTEDVYATVSRITQDASSNDIFETQKHRRRGDAGWYGVGEALRRDPFGNALRDCWKFVMADAGLQKHK